MKTLVLGIFAFFFFNAEDASTEATKASAPETLICEHLGGGSIYCNHFDDGADCFIGIDGDSVYAAGPDC
jgi:hypothetical protein